MPPTPSSGHVPVLTRLLDRRRPWVWIFGLVVAAAVARKMWSLGAILRDQIQGAELYDLNIYRSILNLSPARQYDYLNIDGLGMTYPPMGRVVIEPAGWGSVLEAAIGWTAATLVFYLVLSWLITRRASPTVQWGTPFTRGLAVVGGLVVLTISPPGYDNLSVANIGVFIVGLSFLDGARLIPVLPRGLVSGFCAAIKIIPILYFFYFLAQRDWRAAATHMGTAVGTTALGWLLWPETSKLFWTNLLFDSTRVGPTGILRNATLNGALYQILGREAPFVLMAAVSLVFLAVGLLACNRLAASGEWVLASATFACLCAYLTPIGGGHREFAIALTALTLLAHPRIPHWWRALGAILVISGYMRWMATFKGLFDGWRGFFWVSGVLLLLTFLGFFWNRGQESDAELSQPGPDADSAGEARIATSQPQPTQA